MEGGEGHLEDNFFMANQKLMIISLVIDGLFRYGHFSCEIDTASTE